MAGGIVKVFADLLITTIPIPLILNLKMQKRQKYGIIVLLALGYLVTAAGAVRVYFTWRVFRATDHTWYQSRAFIASAIENDIAIICACMPTLRPLLPHLLGGPIGSVRSRVKNWTNRSSPSVSHNRSQAEKTKNNTMEFQVDSQTGLVTPCGGEFQKNSKLVIHTSHSYELTEETRHKG
jgi:hypothetical protein